MLLDNPLFTKCGYSFMLDVLSILKPVCKHPNEYITTAKESAKDMYFLRAGKLRVSGLLLTNPNTDLLRTASVALPAVVPTLQ